MSPPEMPPEDQPTYGLTDPNEGETQRPTPGEFGQGKVIGPYRLLELIGAGGMGEVWLAESNGGLMFFPPVYQVGGTKLE